MLCAIIDLIFYSGNFAVWAILGIACIGAAVLVRNYRIVGNVIILEDTIIVNEHDGRSEFLLQNILDLELFLVDVRGEMYAINSISMKQGAGNSINFKMGGTRIKIDFLLERNSVAELGAVIREWSKVKEMRIYNGANVSI